jgi:hypothetical protein
MVTSLSSTPRNSYMSEDPSRSKAIHSRLRASHKADVIRDHHAVTVAQELDNVVLHVITHPADISVSQRAQQPLHAIRADLTRTLRQRPPVLALQARIQC